MTQRPLRFGALFAGYGGLEDGVQSVLGGELAWYSEYEPPAEKNPRPSQAAARIMAYHHPGVPNLGDITQIDWHKVAPVDVLTGGSPCQDISTAGRQAGMRPGTRSGLWGSMVDAIQILRPRLVVWENVRGALSSEANSDLEPCAGCVGDGPGGASMRALGRVLADLADIRYDAWWTCIRASDVGAPHRRLRVFVFAWPADSDGNSVRVEPVGFTGSRCAAKPGRDGPQLRYTYGLNRQGWAPAGLQGEAGPSTRFPADTEGDPRGLSNGDDSTAADAERRGRNRGARGSFGEPEFGAVASRGGEEARRGAPVADSSGDGHERSGSARRGRSGPSHSGDAAAHPESHGWDEGWPEPAGELGRHDASERSHADASDTDGNRRERGLAGRHGPEIAPTSLSSDNATSNAIGGGRQWGEGTTFRVIRGHSPAQSGSCFYRRRQRRTGTARADPHRRTSP